MSIEKNQKRELHSKCGTLIPQRLRFLALAPALLFGGCDGEPDELNEGQKLLTQTLLEEDFDSGLWPDTFTQPDCAAVRTRCTEDEFDSKASYLLNDEVVVDGVKYECSGSDCSEPGFEPGTGANWENAWDVAGSCTPDGFSARLLNTCEVESKAPISTLGYENIGLEYEYRTTSYSSTETVTVSYSLDGNSWETLAVHLASAPWTPVSLQLPGDAAQAAGLQVRIQTSADGGSEGTEAAFIDNIRVFGDAPEGCDSEAICEQEAAACGVYTPVESGDFGSCGQVFCGSCQDGESCSETNTCSQNCAPAAVCGTNVCGTVQIDGCGEVACGTCGDGKSCVDGGCFGPCSLEVCENAVEPPHLTAAKIWYRSDRGLSADSGVATSWTNSGSLLELDLLGELEVTAEDPNFGGRASLKSDDGTFLSSAERQAHRFLWDGSDMMLVSVLRLGAEGGYQTIAGNTTTALGEVGVTISIPPASDTINWYTVGDSTHRTSSVPLGEFTGQTLVFVAKYDSTAQEMKFWINGRLQLTRDYSGFAFSDAAATRDWSVGSDPSAPFRGSLSDVVALEGTFSDADALRASSFFAALNSGAAELCRECDPEDCGEDAAVCAASGVECGRATNACGRPVRCGVCSSGEVCSDSGSCDPDPCPDCGALTPSDIASLESYVDCERSCSYGKTALYATCVGDGSEENYGCGPTHERWDKNRDGVVDELDHRLALLEAAGSESEPTVCIENGAVVPIEACGLNECEATRRAAGSPSPEADCRDLDGDGLLAFQEALVGTSDIPGDDDVQFSCGQSDPCKSFAQECNFVAPVNQRLCQVRRECEGLADGEFGGNCTAFHLREVSQDADEVIVRIHYDYSPIPAGVLDLNVTYDEGTLVLADARPIGGLASAGKELDARHVSDGKLRLTVLGAASSAPIPRGPLAELVFVRLSSSQSTLGFSVSDFDQIWSIAPEQGEATDDLKNDEAWGGVAGSADRVREISVGGSDDNSARLLLHLSFDNPTEPLDLSRAPSGNELCELSPNSGERGACVDATIVQGIASDSERGKAEADRAVHVARLDAMQRGVVQSERRIDGVSGPALFLDGISDHLELPLTLSKTQANGEDDVVVRPGDQSLTLSLWFYSEGDGTPGERQVLWSHNNPTSEKTQYALTINPDGAGGFSIEWLSGDVRLGEGVETIRSALEPLRWYNIAAAFDAETGEAKFFIDGNLAHSVSGQEALSCPQSRAPLGGLLVHEEGDFVSVADAKPEQIFFTSTESNLFGIEKMDPNGLARQTVRRTGLDSAPDAHFQPGLNKLVFSSSETGNTEIWVANGDGSEARQITFGFGDTERKIFARRPRWVPGGSGVVFESNVYDVVAEENGARTYRLFYLPYDNAGNQFAIPASADDGTPLTSLDYSTAVADGVVGKYAITASGKNSSNAQFVRGALSGVDRGVVWFTQSDQDWSNPQVANLSIPETQHAAPGGCGKDLWAYQADDCAEVDTTQEVRLLAAGRYSNPEAASSPEPEDADNVSIKLIERRKTTFETVDGFAVSVNGSRATVTYEGATLDAGCWDLDADLVCAVSSGAEDSNGDGLCDQQDCNLYCWDQNGDAECGVGEDTNADGVCARDDCSPTCWDENADGVCTISRSEGPEDVDGDGTCGPSDCHAEAFTGILLKYRDDLVPARGDFDVLLDTTPDVDGETPLSSVGKKLKLRDRVIGTATAVQIDVVADFNVTPIQPGTVVASFDFTGDFTASDLALEREVVEQDLFIQKESSAGMLEPETFPVRGLDFVTAGAFSPDGKELVLAGIEASRPVLVSLDVNPVGSGDERPLRKLTNEPVSTDSLQWISVQRSFPCNWVGAHRDPLSKMFLHGFKGGLDEVKLYSYARSEGAILSEAHRGLERLNKEVAAGETEPPASSAVACSSSSQCASYELCQSGACRMKNCDSDADCGEGEGRCVLAASVGVPGGAEGSYVCSVECATDNQCFEQECLNGPCRFCQQNSCSECRVAVKSVGTGLTVREIEGCPDRNSFDCVAGSCVSECYSFENGESQYLCDPSFEYCRQGKCRLIDWAWSDLSPATFSGLNEMVQGIPDGGENIGGAGLAKRTAVVSQINRIDVTAYGNRDYGNPPRILVQGKVDHPGDGPGFAGARLYGGAWFDVGEIIVYALKKDEGQYSLTTELPLSDIRLLLLNNPMQNMNLASTGRGSTGGDGAFCESTPGWNLDPRACDRRPDGSRSNFGYDVGLWPAEYARLAAEGTIPAAPGPGDYLLPGGATVIIQDVKMTGNSLLSMPSTHRACSYEGSWFPVDRGAGRRRKRWFGDPRVPGANETAGITVNSAQSAWLNAAAARLAPPLLESGHPGADGSASDGTLFLNCSYAPLGEKAAALEFREIPPTLYTHLDYPHSVTNVGGIVTETGSGCTIESGGPIPTGCYEWASDANMDVMNQRYELFQSLEYQEFTSFGYDQ